jgi:hypothetical protein
MQRHTTRLIVAAVLIAAGATGGFFVFDAHRRLAAIDNSAADVSTRLQRLIDTAGAIASAQQAYVAPGQPDEPWLERCAMLLQQFGEQTAAIRPLLHSSDGPVAIDRVVADFRSIVSIDDSARRDLQEGQELLAADVIFSDGREAIDGVVRTLRMLAAAEADATGAMHAPLVQQQVGVFGSVACIWVVGLLMLARVPKPPRTETIARPTGFLQPDYFAEPAAAADAPADEAASAVDLAGAADVCGALARATDRATLQKALGRAASVLDARGVIVWMGAGEELFPALSYGYDDRMVERFGPISRNAANATAEAWRTAQLRTVAGDLVANGAVAAPVHGVAGCVGVFAAEVRNGREADPGTCAVAAIIAAQLAAVVSAWPAGSASDVHKTA